MPFYQSRGEIPNKRHTVFKNPKGGIYYEELVSREGFSYIYSNLYHLNMPTKVKRLGDFEVDDTHTYLKEDHKSYHFINHSINSAIPLLYNKDILIGRFSYDNYSDERTDVMFQRNGDSDLLLYIQGGSGTLKTNYGNLDMHEGDYVVIPRGVIYQIHVNEDKGLYGLEIYSKSPIETPSKYRNRVGQLLEHSPFCERDIKTPTLEEPKNEIGDFLIKTRTHLGIQDHIYAHHPFDIIGWDGYYFPWSLNIGDFEPIVGSIHQPPPVHQTFQAKGFVVCSFVPRLFDFHSDSIPAPYPHSNVDSDELIYYSKGDFMSRQGIQSESITHHPMGLPHGPQPGKYKSSIGKKSTDELAVMIDTFNPLKITKAAKNIDDKKYSMSWLD